MQSTLRFYAAAAFAASAGGVGVRPIRVLCVDDNFLVVEAVRHKLASVGGFDWAGSLSRADRLVETASETNADVVVLDIDMPGRDPFDAMLELARTNPNARVLMLTGHVRRELVDRAFESGAWGYVSKSLGSDEIVSAIRRVQSGEVVVSDDVRLVMKR